MADWVWDNPAAVMEFRKGLLRRKPLFAIFMAWPLILLAGLYYLTKQSVTAEHLSVFLIFAYAGLFFGLPAVAAAPFVRDHSKRQSEALRLTLLSPAQLICGRFLALFTVICLPILLAVPLVIGAAAISPGFAAACSSLSRACGPGGFALRAVPAVALQISLCLAVGFACGTAIRHPVGAVIAAATGASFIGFGVPTMFLFMLDSVFGNGRPGPSPDMMLIFYLLCHLLAAVMLLMGAQQQLLAQDKQADAD